MLFLSMFFMSFDIYEKYEEKNQEVCTLEMFAPGSVQNL